MNKEFQVFLAHASENKNVIRELRNKLVSDGIDPWFDEDSLEPGDKWREVIPKEIERSDIFLACLSKEAINKTGYIQRELRYALVAYSKRPQEEVYLIPVRLDECEIPHLQLPELGINLTDFQYVDLWKEDGYARLIRKIKKNKESLEDRKAKKAHGIVQPILRAEQWESLERAARDTAATAGFAAMGYYRNALAESSAITSSQNPSTVADENATVATLQSLNSFQSVADELGYNYRIFAEELDSPKVAPRILDKLMGNTVYSKIKTSTEAFRLGWEHSISILIDAIDGTANFDAWLPFFCSSVALFIGGKLSVGAIYDPIHNQVYYGSLRVLEDGREKGVANVWNVHTGNLDMYSGKGNTISKRKLISTHITRSDAEARNRFLRFLPKLYEEKELKGGTYMLNCGLMALANVACGNLAAFINNTTGIWDVAAGEVLIRATGGKISDFTGRDIDYGESSRISVIASESCRIHKIIESQVKRNYPWDE